MKNQIERAEPSRGAPSWSKMMAEMQPCGHTNAQHLYHDSGDIKIDLSACLVHTSIEHAGQNSGGTTADVAKAASAAPEPSRGAPEAAQAWILVAEGEGASARTVYGDLHDALHRFMCVCGKSWDACESTGVTDDIRMIDDPDEWFIDEDGKPFGIKWPSETGMVAVYRADRESGHVVLLEALRRIKVIAQRTTPPYAASALVGILSEAEAAIQQAERT